MSRRVVSVIASDTHCDFAAWERRDGLTGDSYFSFSQLVDAACSFEVPLQLAGDTINTKHPDSQTVAFLRKQFSRLQRQQLPLYHIEGQHEAARPSWFEAAHSWPKHMHAESYEVADIRFYGLNWTPPDQLPELLNGIHKNTEVLLCHQVTENLMGALRKCDLALEQIPFAQLVFVGDFHQHLKLDLLNRQGKPMRVFSPGSTCMRKIDEPPKKGYYLLYDDLSVESQWLKTRAVLQPPRLNTVEQLDQFVEEVVSQIETAEHAAASQELPETLHKPLLWVHYVETLENAWSRIQKAVGNRAFLFKRVHLLETEEKIEKREKRKKRAARGAVAAMGELLPDHDSFAYKAARRLLETESTEIGTALQQLGVEYGITTGQV